ncbi:MAG: hypothetical protein ACR2NG_00525 [Acidimicrobiia bacterium]
MALFKRRKYAPPNIGSALDPYHYPDDVTGKPAASPSPNAGRALNPDPESTSERPSELDTVSDETVEDPASDDS